MFLDMLYSTISPKPFIITGLWKSWEKKAKSAALREDAPTAHRSWHLEERGEPFNLRGAGLRVVGRGIEVVRSRACWAFDFLDLLVASLGLGTIGPSVP